MKVTYIDHMGSDLTVVNAARVSFNKQHEQFDEVKDINLIKYLAKHKHWTPFSHVSITCRIKAPVFLARQLFKHKIGFTENEVSRRYVDSTPEFYNPDVWRQKTDNKKQGSSENPVKEPLYPFLKNDTTYKAVEVFYETALEMYQDLLDNGTCSEQARMVLPQAMFTEWYWTGSLVAWARVYNLRSSSDAQKENHILMEQINEIMQDLYPVSWKELTKKNDEQTTNSRDNRKRPAPSTGRNFGTRLQKMRQSLWNRFGTFKKNLFLFK